MNPNIFYFLVTLLVTFVFPTVAYSIDNDVRGCWRTENREHTLTDGSVRNEKGYCFTYFDDDEVTSACNFRADPDARFSNKYQVIKRGEEIFLVTGEAPYTREEELKIDANTMRRIKRFDRPMKFDPNGFASSSTNTLIRQNFSDSKKCLSQALHLSIEPIELAPWVIDQPLRYFNAKIELHNEIGKIFWLDANHFAATAVAGKPGSSERRFDRSKIELVDIRDKSITTLVEDGSLLCANTSSGLVALRRGNYYRGNLSEPQFFRWDSKNAKLVEDESFFKPSARGNVWSWTSCTEIPPELANRDQRIDINKGKLFLRPEDGSILWNSTYSKSYQKSTGFELVNASGSSKTLDISLNELQGISEYKSFLNGYILAIGQYATGRLTFSDGLDKFRNQYPLVTMSRDGVVMRTYVPEALSAYFNKHHSSEGHVFPTASGLLIYNGGFSQSGGGIYLSKGGVNRRIWCSGPAGFDMRCQLTQFEISPDGCTIAFSQKNEEQIIVLPLCENK